MVTSRGIIFICSAARLIFFDVTVSNTTINYQPIYVLKKQPHINITMPIPIIAVASGELLHMTKLSLIKCICSDENNLKERLTQLETWILKRGYLHKSFRPEIEQVNLMPREDLLKKSEKIADKPVTLLLTNAGWKTEHWILLMRYLKKLTKLTNITSTGSIM